MNSYSFTPTYFEVSWNNNTPTNYSNLAGNQAGGLDSETAWQIQSLIITTGGTAVSGTPFTAGSTIIINNYTVTFSDADTLATAIVKINLMTKFTGVYADQSVASGYVTLQNAPGYEGTQFYVQEGNGTALATLGLNNLGYYPIGQYTNFFSQVGTSAYSTVGTNSNVTINGVTITFVSGDIQSTVSQINTYTAKTGVAAEIAGPYVQLECAGWVQPWVINGGNALANIGFAVGTYTGYPSNITLSEDKERANMRWNQVVAQMESTATPNYFGSITRTGNIGNAALNTITWTVGYEQYDQLYTTALPTEPDYGNVFVGTAAIQRWVARAMTSTSNSNRKVSAPCTSIAAGVALYDNPAQILNITAQGVDIVANIVTVSNNIVVTQLPGI